MEVFLQVVGVLTTIPFTWIYKLLKWAYTWPEEEGIYDRQSFEHGSEGVYGFEDRSSAGFDERSAYTRRTDEDVGPFQSS